MMGKEEKRKRTGETSPTAAPGDCVNVLCTFGHFEKLISKSTFLNKNDLYNFCISLKLV